MPKTPIIGYWDELGVSTEPDMRSEFIHTLEGFHPELAKGKLALLRRFRRNSQDRLTLCSCVDQVTGEPDKDAFCPISFSEKHLWDESEILVYQQIMEENLRSDSKPAGLLNIPASVFYIRYNEPVTEDDKIVEVALGFDGRPNRPFRRVAVYRIDQLVGLRAEGGRLEYWKAICMKEFVKFLNPPT